MIRIFDRKFPNSFSSAPKPFDWHLTEDRIIESIASLSNTINSKANLCKPYKENLDVILAHQFFLFTSSSPTDTHKAP
jgi:hypothetical protein